MALFLKLIVTAVGATALTAAFGINETRSWEEMLPMRDGIKLHTRIIMPKDDSNGGTFTTIIDRSPYGYGDLEWIPDLYLPGGFVTVGQDMRGTKMSEGNFTIWHQDADDSQDLGDWIVQQPWSNGKIYSLGASADGLAAMTTVHKKEDGLAAWLEAQYFIWTASVGYEVFYPNGAICGELVDSWIHGTVEFPEGWSDECYKQILENEMHSDWWGAVELTGEAKSGTGNLYQYINHPSAFWAGWYDIFLVGNLEAYRGFNEESDESVRHTSKIVIDPLGHCQSGAEYFPQDLIAGRTLLSFMQSYELFGMRPVGRTDVKNVTFYVMSSNDEAGLSAANFWTSMETFPEPTMVKHYLHADGTSSTEAPTASAEMAYVYDPSNPVPSMGGNNLDMPCGPLDQAEIDTRSDVLKFQTAVQEEPVYLTGPLFATLYVSSDVVDTDFMVRISDVYPTGEVRLIQDSALRMRWREGGLEPVMMVKDEVYEITATLWNTSYVIAPGHAVRMVVTSSNDPRFSVNPNNGRSLIDEFESPGEKIVANNVLHSSPDYPSHFSLPVVTADQLPKMPDIKAMFNKAYPELDADTMIEQHGDILGKVAEISKNKRAGAKKNAKK